MSIIDEKTFSRAALLKGGAALVITMAVPGSVLSSAATLVEAADDWPSPDAGQLDSWIAIGADGRVTMFTGKVNIGNGSVTGLAQIVAEELDVAFDMVDVVQGDTARTIDQGATVGSQTIVRAGPHLRQAAADARYALLQMAATQLNTTADKLAVRNGVVSLQSDASKTVSYSSLIGGKLFNQNIGVKGSGGGMVLGGKGTPKSPSQYRVVGTNVPRPDIEEKVTVNFSYVHDLKFPDMLHGRVIRPTGLGAQLLSVGKPPKGVQVVRKGNFLGVVAAKEWDAIKAARTLKVKWSDWNGLPKTNEVYDALRKQPITDRVVQTSGDVTKGLASAAKTLSATYLTPFETHGSLGPSCAVADVRSDQAVIYSGTAGPHGMRNTISQLLNLPLNSVHIIFQEASGDYGDNGADPCAVDAAIMSSLVGKPVRVQWMREDEHGWDPKGPAMVADLHGGLDSQGNVVAWNHESWNPPTGTTLMIGSLLAGTPVGKEGVGSWAGPLLYTFPNSQQLNHGEVDLGGHDNGMFGIITAHLRSPAQYQITFAMESFMDELAAAAGADPVQFRLNYLTDQRMIDLLLATAEKAKWDARPSPQNITNSKAQFVRGRGVGISQRGGTYNAEVAFVRVDRKTGKVDVEKIVVGEDHGLTVNPRQVQLQIESGVVQTVSRALFEEIQLSTKAITSVNWETYPILRFMDMPKIETLILDHPEFPATGVGEPSSCPVAAVITNAIFDATGVRIRQLPLRPERVKAALVAAKVAL